MGQATFAFSFYGDMQVHINFYFGYIVNVQDNFFFRLHHSAFVRKF